ncbi:MAG: SO_0444 family Cu/Zn efflux transporter [Phycisphaerae bacterium]|jgi:uncharacterized membrane protein YraQ (UPF0718 family)/copper chaperone CopZ|nr:SO_0444 family Cu/Zn efflux transporter [Phycisphaerae bacterium]
MQDMGWQIVVEFWRTLAEMSPYLLFGFFVAGVLSVLIRQETVERHLGGEGFVASVKASVFGVPMPLCSCGVIPVSASLRRHGAGRGATTSFLISTPQTGVDSILVTYSLLGWVYAVFRPLVAFASGLIGGALVSMTTRNLPDDAPAPLDDTAHGCDHGHDGDCDDGAASPKPICTEACCDSSRSRTSRILHYGLVELPQDIGRSLLIGLVVAALISALVPAGKLPGILGGGIVSMLIMMAAGIPIYVCATASVPIALALVVKGVSPGAALVFLMTGPATNAATVVTIGRVMGKRTAVIYMLTVAACALGAGLLLDAIYTHVPAAAESLHHHTPTVAIWKQVAAVALLGVLGYALIKPRLHRAKGGPSDLDVPEETVVLNVRGMTCNHCAASIRRALEETDDVGDARVDLSAGRAIVSGWNLTPATLVQVVETLGYEAEPIEDVQRARGTTSSKEGPEEHGPE